MKLTDDTIIPIYNPSEDDLKWKFAGADRVLKARDITGVPRREVSVVLVQLRDLGVCELPLFGKKEEVDKVLEKADWACWNALSKRNMDLVLSEADKQARAKSAGVPLEESPEVKQARKWLEEHKNPPEENA